MEVLNLMRIVLDPGHGGKQPGASYYGLKEKDVVLDIALKVHDRFVMEPKFWVALTRMSDVYVSLRDRCLMANAYCAKYFISLHCNACRSHKARGAEIFYYKGSKRGRKVAELFEPYVKNFIDQPFRGIKESERLYVLKHTDMPAILIEIGFIDDIQTNELLKRDAVRKHIAGLIVEGINKLVISRI